jgi:hypothetical protein
VPDVVLPGDLESGDLIVLPDSQDQLIVVAVGWAAAFPDRQTPSRPGGIQPGESRPELVITLAVGAEIRRVGRMPPATLLPATLLPAQVTAANAMDSGPSPL